MKSLIYLKMKKNLGPFRWTVKSVPSVNKNRLYDRGFDQNYLYNLLNDSVIGSSWEISQFRHFLNKMLDPWDFFVFLSS